MPVCYYGKNEKQGMHNIISSKLEASRKELLDLGMRNPLLNYRLSPGKGVKVVREQSRYIYDILVVQGKSMSFVANPSRKDVRSENDVVELPPLTDDGLQQAYTDTKLQTDDSEQNLQKRLLNTYYDARTSLEEQGVNILYIALGMLQWYESDTSEEAHLAPLVLVPVELERTSAGERFKLRYTGAEIISNISLQAKLKLDFALTIPAVNDTEDFKIDTYFNDIGTAVKAMKRWRVDNDAISLGFFSFGKFMLYNDLDGRNWKEDNQPSDHPILRALLDTGFTDPAPTIGEEAFIDDCAAADNLFQVMDADSSQVLAMLAVDEGRNMVIQGPPGTGKSQTIANIIANSVGKGKTVLFVAEKMAALEVVKRRLDNIHLGEACLELHSHKANKKQLHEELRRVLELGRPNIKQLEREAMLLHDYKRELNTYCAEVNTIVGRSGLSLHHIYGRIIALAERCRDVIFPKLVINDIATWDQEKMHRTDAYIDRLSSRLKSIGTPSALLFWGSGIKLILPKAQDELREQMGEAVKRLAALQAILKEAAESVGLPEINDEQQMRDLLSLLNVAGDSPQLSGMAIKNASWERNESLIAEILETGNQLTMLRSKYEHILQPAAWNTDVSQIKAELIKNGSKWWNFLIGSYKAANRHLSTLCKAELPKDNSSKLQYLIDIEEGKRLHDIMSRNTMLMQDCFQSQWQELHTKWNDLKVASRYLAQVHKDTQAGKCPPAILDYLGTPNPSADANALKDKINKLNDLYQSALSDVLRRLDFDAGIRFENGTSFAMQQYHLQAELLQQWYARIEELHQAIAWNNLVETGMQEGLADVINIAEAWTGADVYLKELVHKNWYECLMEEALKTRSAVRKFEYVVHEEAVDKFKMLDVSAQHYHRAKAALKHYEGVPKLHAGGQVNILKTEFNKKTRHLPIRKLMLEAGLAIQATKPVFMMSPLSIANYLPPDSLTFDLVIFDEASQVKPVDAFGAIVRGRQLVVVGDSKQMPPTSFFDSLTKEGDGDDEENVTADLPSILSLCDAKGAPQRMLRWHYRSRHESLISVSNHEFYESKLVICPSPGSKHRLGLVYNHLKNTAYDRGKTRSNPLEAEAVAEAVIKHARTTPKQSLGVVAFSTSQMKAIQDTLEIKRRQHPELETFFNTRGAEPFFVKNLENVQGDERDVIYISIGYGRTAEGFLSMSFGPLNSEGGERRLNVLITRAKLRCEVFTNLTSDDIDLSKTQKRGIRTLKSFLQFAQKGIMDLPEDTGLDADSPFEEMVAERLRNYGFTVKNQVGSKGFFIDLAIVDPDNPGRYLLAIECDGATYHSSRSARDRDRLRQSVLEMMGWRFYRIWSTDWFRNTEREFLKLVRAINDARNQALIDDETIAEAEAQQQAALQREQIVEVTIPRYQTALLTGEIATKELHLHPVGKLAQWIEEVVRVESPVHFDEVARRIAEATGASKVGARMRDALEQAAKLSATKGQIRNQNQFLWHKDMDKPMIRSREELPTASRKIGLIAPEEIGVAVLDVVRNSVAIDADAIVPIAAKAFGFARVTEDVKNNILSVIAELQKNKALIQEGSWLKVKAEGNG